MKHYKIGIIGLGSIGTRHIKNIVEVLNSRNCTFQIDLLLRSGKGKEPENEIKNYIHQTFYSFDEIPDDYDIIFITNPTYLHFQTIKKFINKTKHMFIEKPVFDKVNLCLEDLNLKSESQYYVACPLRYTRTIEYLKNELKSMKVFSVRAICSSYLPEWRPGQDYRDSYSAHKDQGGGVSIDLIHEWDYLCYLFGQPEKIFNMRGNFSDLEINSEDLSLYIAKYKNMTIEVHLDYFGRKSIREVQIFTDKETIVGDLINSEIRYLKSEKTITFPEQRDDYQRKEISHFIDIVEGKRKNDNDIKMAFKILRIVKEGE